MKITKINDMQCIAKKNPTFTSNKLVLVGTGLLAMGLSSCVENASVYTSPENGDLMLRIQVGDSTSGGNSNAYVNSEPSRSNARAAKQLADDMENLTNTEYSIEHWFERGRGHEADYLTEDGWYKPYANTGNRISDKLVQQAVTDGNDFYNYTDSKPTLEGKMPELIKELNREHPELTGPKFDSALLAKTEIFKNEQIAMDKNRIANYVTTMFKKGLQSIKDSVEGKDLHPENVVLREDFHSNKRLQAFFVGQVRGRKDFAREKAKEMEVRLRMLEAFKKLKEHNLLNDTVRLKNIIYKTRIKI